MDLELSKHCDVEFFVAEAGHQWPITSSSHAFKNSESRKPLKVSMKFVICFDLLLMDLYLRIKIYIIKSGVSLL